MKAEHVTNPMFKRYRIVDTSDVKGALKQRASYELAQLEEARIKAAQEAARLAEEAARLAEAATISARVQ